MGKADDEPPLTNRVVEGSHQKFPIKIAKIAAHVENGSTPSNDDFQYKEKMFRPISGFNIKDLRNVAGIHFGFLILDETNENEEKKTALWLALTSNFELNYCHHRDFGVVVRRFIREFFIVAKKNLFDENEDIDSGIDEDYSNSVTAFSSTVENLYKHLEAAHAVDDVSGLYTDEYIQHASLMVTLKPYQVKTVKWMLSRERVPKYHTNGFVEIKRRSIGSEDESTRFFYNPKTCNLTTDPDIVRPVLIPTGGILAEEMGMGKTIEILDLILLHPRRLDKRQFSDPPIAKAIERPVTKADLKCLCVQTRIVDSIRCTKCSKVQHRKCVDHQDSEITPDASYICPCCWENEELIPAKTTLIVSPQSIKMQWKTEIDKRIQAGTMSAFVYVGSKSCKWISPAKLASYDVILTDYETLRSEFDFTGRNSSTRVLRNSSTTIKRKSPLLRMNFWRVCLDESQMVSDMRTKHSILISDLSAVHRWAVTGTPIQTTLDDLFGLVSFIDYSPYNKIGRWHEIVQQLNVLANFEPIVSVLQPIMRRTCKTDSIMAEMDVPKQRQEVHMIEISSLDRHHYNEERLKCSKELNKLIKAYHVSTRLTTLSPYALEQLMEPVRTLRRLCSIIHVTDKQGNTIVMRPQQMLNHLINTNVSGAKFELASILSKLKCFVALGTGNHKRRDNVAGMASETCQNLLNWSKDYQNEPTMIESLLQIQVTQFFALVKRQNTSSNIDLASLEKNFYGSQLEAIIHFKADRQKDVGKLRDSEAYFQSNCHKWAHAILTGQKSDLQLFCQIKSRTNAAYENVTGIVASNASVLNTLAGWSQNLLVQRKIFKQSFAQLDNLVSALESTSDKEKLAAELFAILSKEATICHLKDTLDISLNGWTNDDDEEEVDEPPTKRARIIDSNSYGPTASKKAKTECTLCSIWKQLERYGSFISDNAHKMTNKAARGGENINPSFQEFILKVILQSNEYLGNINTKVGIDLLTALENFRFEFHAYKNLLTSIRQNVNSFLRVQKNRPPKPTVTVDVTAMDYWMKNIESSKETYSRLVRVNRYLNSMKENVDIDECSICMTPIVQCVSFQCGHQCCDECFAQLRHTIFRNFECPFCRRMQRSDTVRHFTVDTGEKFTDSSTKIEHIVREVHKLKQSDPKVKILLFSQWADVLYTLKNELLSNDIASRNMMNTSKSFQKMLEEFKDPQKNITCLLMPYKYGSKGLNLIEATHVFLVEPILNRGEELQTLGRVHRIGQQRETVVHRFITKNTIEETIFKVMSTEAAGLLASDNCTIKTLLDLFVDTDSEASTA
ncbi:E3 ubiquitin-protein ligase SHPRH-like [Bradysia coprophila]|uniref:E3 ubiquitin-protein ligase SHPRH-like n=1 Tax=Bradysia coprophila TaxID=38358 RepID=UPI00187DA512|nr:E3 ubiquitin-protein ligase SHPRH-like [Bradysia coprophila]